MLVWCKTLQAFEVHTAYADHAHLRQRGEPPTKDNSLFMKIRVFLIQCARPLMHAGRSVARSWGRVSNEWKDFKLWWHDPIKHSQGRHYGSLPLPTVYRAPPQRRMGLPQRSSSFSAYDPNDRKQPAVVISPLSSLSPPPRRLSFSRLAPPQSVTPADGHGYFDQPGSSDAAQRHTFEGRPTSETGPSGAA